VAQEGLAWQNDTRTGGPDGDREFNLGYMRICGALRNLGHDVGRNTVKRILADHGIEPAPERRKRIPWSTFLKAHWGAIAATDFFTVADPSPIPASRFQGRQGH